MRDYKLGRLPADPSLPRLKLASFLSATAPTYPENVDWLAGVERWPMYLNDRIGDCTCATAGHMIQNMSRYGQGTTVTITDKDVLTAYSAVSGYDPRTGANDNGAVVQHVLNYWRKTGVGGHKILAFAEVDLHDPNEVRAATNIFGNVYLGIDFPETGFDQLDAGQPWDYVPGARSLGGHAINAAYYDVSDNMWKVVTWGQVQPMTQAFWDKYVFEAWVVISPEWFDANGRNPSGLDMYALGEKFRELTGEANPFPEPAPDPFPSPVPPPVVETPTDVFEKDARAWLERNPFFYRDFQRKLREWLDSLHK